MPLPNIKELYEKGWKAIIMPHKIEYSVSDLGSFILCFYLKSLGPPTFIANQNIVKRTDLELRNKHGNAIACSFFEQTSSVGPLPCVVYLHANGSCRLEALQYSKYVLSLNIHYFCFDFSGCGLSGGTYTSVGHYEQDDIERVVEYLKESKKVSKIALWGRSMGAVTTIFYTAKNPAISCIVLDTPFADFKRLVLDLIKNRSRVPQFLVGIGLRLIRRTIRKKAKFDIYSVKPIEHITKIKVPALFGAPRDDTFVSPQHTKDLYIMFEGIKRMQTFEGDHNSQRSIEWELNAIDFIKVYLLGQQSKLTNS